MTLPQLQATVVHLRAADGLDLHVRRWADPEVATRSTFVVAHGLGEHSGRYQGFAAWFAPRGVLFFAPDLRGHGKSGGPRGHADSLRGLLDDLDRVVAHARQDGAGPLVLVAHSWGGLLAIAYALEHQDRLDRAVLSAPALMVRQPVPGYKRVLGRLLPVVAPRLVFSNDIDPSVLSRDPTVTRAYASDPLVHDRISAGLYGQTFLRAETLIARAPELRLPFLLLHGAEDGLIDPQGSQRFFARATAPGRAFHLYPGLYHEIFNEPERERVFRDIEEWLATPASAVPAASP